MTENANAHFTKPGQAPGLSPASSRSKPRYQPPAYGTRPVRSDFYASARASAGSLCKTNRGRWAIKSVPNAIRHMQLDTYGARLCEVWDERQGHLYAQIKRDLQGNLSITYLSPVLDDRKELK